LAKFKTLNLNNFSEKSKWEDKIFRVGKPGFNQLALELFRFQYSHNEIYKNYVDTLGVKVEGVDIIEKVPYLPIGFFKSGKVMTTEFNPEVVFESSGTTGENTSHHFVKNLSVYKKSFLEAFIHFYGRPDKWCILALLPGYLSRKNSSLVLMADHLIKTSGHPKSGFYLDEYEELYRNLVYNEMHKQPVLLLGVTFALMDFAKKYSMRLGHTIVMETGGMKGRGKELTRIEIHDFLKSRLGVSVVHSEYGMTELLSQAYSKGNGFFTCPPWMKVLIREENDPFAIKRKPLSKKPVSGLLNIVDLANIYSSSFIATDDVGRLYEDGSFEVMGRKDSSDTRGCNLLIAV
jgi:hypothetical protein